MKKITAISFILLLLLPGVGVHLDLSYCCGTLEEVGVAHQVEMEMATCCDDSHRVSCMSASEIIQPPTQLNFTSIQDVSAQIDVSGIVSYFDFSVHSISKEQSHSLLVLRPPPKRDFQSLFQVFLC